MLIMLYMPFLKTIYFNHSIFASMLDLFRLNWMHLNIFPPPWFLFFPSIFTSIILLKVYKFTTPCIVKRLGFELLFFSYNNESFFLNIYNIPKYFYIVYYWQMFSTRALSSICLIFFLNNLYLMYIINL